MSSVLDHLETLYADTDDPWHFATSPYEQAKFRATRKALTRDRYRSALEIGCGNGALAHHLALLCDSYTGIDAVSRAVIAAQNRVPDAHFLQAVYPCPLPAANYDLIILSEVLYFLTPDAIRQLARDLVDLAPGAELICVTYLGDTAQALQGRDTLTVFQSALPEGTILKSVADTGAYSIDRGEIPR
ncbi:SAM-dependent methyltransferase [Loktanella sp. M215]|uniref:SAM-dependent methyltransferase n=1 Tax=Loktanella sp. M215 TaxID=2675431 RepID=UPI001F239A12|nr:SAM-dependent methyltransferase [Loktanella sp. M215]MCF7701719.1 methyltransferase domain-containing protein [Loktanella sp. M215]